MEKPLALRLPVVSAGAEFLVMGHLMRRNILAYKAPAFNEGYDLICIHPDPRHKCRKGEQAQVRVQVKSRYPTNATGFPIKANSINAFDFLIIVFMNIGIKNRPGTGSPVEIYTFPRSFIRAHIKKESIIQKVDVGTNRKWVERYKDEKGFELIADVMKIEHPIRLPLEI